MQDLCPQFLSELPKDPHTGKDYLFVRRGNMLTVYSVSGDGRDDGGTTRPFDEKPGDLGARIGMFSG